MKFYIDKIEYKNIEKKAELQQKQIVLLFSISDKMKDVGVFTTVESLKTKLKERNQTEKVAFVPTMGALHHGHIALVEEAKNRAKIVVVSIFVNPTQFDNKKDLNKYPRTLESDVELLKAVGNVIVFAPSVEEVYPESFETVSVDLGGLENVMEGSFRAGHFNGVVNVVNRLFEIVEPDFALFGEKDFQQLAVIKRMVAETKSQVQIVPCKTVREDSGLASSSRNSRLTEVQQKSALIIIKTMRFARELSKTYSPVEVKEMATVFFQQASLELEYLEIVDPTTLKPIEEWVPETRICIAAYCGEVRLIDNMAITE